MSSLEPLQRTACPTCDLRLEVSDLEEGEKAECPRCGARVASRCHGDWQRVAALSAAACVALAVALAEPYLSLRSAGGDPSTTVWRTAWELVAARPGLAVVVGLLFLAIPAAQALGMLSLSLAFLASGRPLWSGWARVAKAVQALRPWSMADVLLVGTLVSLIKIVSLAQVAFGAGFWAFAAFAVLLTGASGSVDTRRTVALLGGKT